MAQELDFHQENLNLWGLGTGNGISWTWDDLVFRIDYEKRIDDSVLGIDIPAVNAGFTPYIHATAGLEARLGLDAGTVAVDWNFTVPETVLAAVNSNQAVWDTTAWSFDPAGSGVTPVSGDSSKNFFDLSLVYGIQAGIKDISASISIPVLPDPSTHYPK